MTKRTKNAIFLIMIATVISQLSFIPNPYRIIVSIVLMSVALILLIIDIVKNRLLSIAIDTFKLKKQTKENAESE